MGAAFLHRMHGVGDVVDVIAQGVALVELSPLSLLLLPLLLVAFNRRVSLGALARLVSLSIRRFACRILLSALTFLDKVPLLYEVLDDVQPLDDDTKNICNPKSNHSAVAAVSGFRSKSYYATNQQK